jgi:hypothetical protein
MRKVRPTRERATTAQRWPWNGVPSLFHRLVCLQCVSKLLQETGPLAVESLCSSPHLYSYLLSARLRSSFTWPLGLAFRLMRLAVVSPPFPRCNLPILPQRYPFRSFRSPSCVPQGPHLPFLLSHRQFMTRSCLLLCTRCSRAQFPILFNGALGTVNQSGSLVNAKDEESTWSMSWDCKPSCNVACLDLKLSVKELQYVRGAINNVPLGVWTSFCHPEGRLRSMRQNPGMCGSTLVHYNKMLPYHTTGTVSYVVC